MEISSPGNGRQDIHSAAVNVALTRKWARQWRKVRTAVPLAAVLVAGMSQRKRHVCSLYCRLCRQAEDALDGWADTRDP